MSCGGGTNTVTQNAQPPQAVLDAYTKLIQAGQAQAQTPLQQYGGPLIAGFSPQQQQAFSTIQNAQGIAQPYINAGAGMVGASSAPITPNGLFTGSDLSGLAQAGLGYTNSAANTGIAAAGQPGINMATGAGSSAPGIAGAAGARANAAAGTDPSQVSRYFDPFLNSAVSATQAEFDNQNRQTAQGITSNAIKSGAGFGDRADVAQAIAMNQEQLAQAPVIAGMESQGYQSAQQALAQQEALQAGTALNAGNLGLAGASQATNAGLGVAGLSQNAAGQQGQLGLNAAQQLYGLFGGQQQTGLAAAQASGWLGENAGAMLAGLGSQAENTALTGASANLQAGQEQQQLAQEQLNVPYEQFLARQAYPYQNLQFLAGLTTGAGSNAGGMSSTTSPGPSTLSQIGGAGLAGVGLIGATGGFGSGGWLSSLGSSIGSMFKRGGAVGYDAGGGVPDVSLTYIPDVKTTHGSGPPKAPNAPPQDDPLAQGLASMKDSGNLRSLFHSASDPALAGKMRGIDATWDAINASPETAGDFRASKYGGRTHRADGGGIESPNYIGADPAAQGAFGRFAAMPEEQLRELAVRMPPNSAQGSMIRRALQQKQMMPANDNTMGLAATGTDGPSSGLAAGGVVQKFADGGSGGAVSDLVRAELAGGHGRAGSFTPGISGDLNDINLKASLAGLAADPNAPMSFTPGPRGTSIPQVGNSVFAQPTGLDAGGGLPGWFNPLSQGLASASPITTQMPKAVLDALNPPPPVAVSVSGGSSGGSTANDPGGKDSGHDTSGGGSGSGGGAGGGGNGGGSDSSGSSSSSSSSSSSKGTGPGSNTGHLGSTLGMAGTGLGMATGLGGLGLAGNIAGTISDEIGMNKDLERIGAPQMGFKEGLLAVANDATMGLAGRSLDQSLGRMNLDGTAAMAGMTGAQADEAGGINGVGESAAGADDYGSDTRDEGDRESGREGFGGGTTGGTSEGGDRESGRDGFGGNGHESSDHEGTESAGGDGGGSGNARRGGRMRVGLAAGGTDDDDDDVPASPPGDSLAAAAPPAQGGLADTQPATPDPHDAVDVKGGTPEFTPGKPSPWMSLLTAGAATMAGRSPYGLSNIGQGLLAGTKEYERENELDAKPEVDHSGETVRIYYPSEKKWIDTGLPTNEAQRTRATSADAKARLEQTGAYQTESLRLQGQRAQTAADTAAATRTYQQNELGLRQAQIDQGKTQVHDVRDAYGNVIGYDVIDTRTGKKVSESRGGDGGNPVAPSSPDVHGEDYLKEVGQKDPMLPGMIRAIANGDEPTPTGMYLRTPQGQMINKAITQYDPDFTSSRAATIKAFNSGKQGDATKFLSTAVQHLATLDQLAAALKSGDVQLLNRAKQAWREQFGSDAPTNFDTARDIVGGEVVKGIVGAGGAERDRERAQSAFQRYASPEQISGATQTARSLLTGQLAGLQQQFVSSLEPNLRPDRVDLLRQRFQNKLTPEARLALVPHETSGGGGKSEAAPAGLVLPPADKRIAGKTTTPDGKYLWNGSGWDANK